MFSEPMTPLEQVLVAVYALLQLWLFWVVAVVLGVWLLKWRFERASHYWMDYTTGFLKMRDRMRWQQLQELWKLGPTVKDEGPYAAFAQTIGTTESSGFVDALTVAGSYRPTHTYIVGASGSGKSSLLLNLVLQDFQHGMGVALIDPHGDLVQGLMPHLGKRKDSAVILDLADTEHVLAYNPLQRRAGVSVAEQTGKLLLAFKRIWEDSWGPRMEDILRHSLSLLIEQGYTLAEFPKLLNDSDFRAMLLAETKLGQAHEFFTERYNRWDLRTRIERTESSLNKISAFMADERIGLALSQAKSSFNVREVMDTGGILLVNLAKGHLAGNADLFGALLMADIETAFLSRKPAERKPFALYVDEFQNVATESFSTFLAEARKFGLCLTMAHQTTKQLDDKLVALILGNAQTQIYFRVSREDAERFSKESANIVAEIEAQHETPLLQDEEQIKLTLQELWEVAYHKLSRLPARQAFVMVKGALHQPELIKTLDNPVAVLKFEFDYDGKYRDQEALEARKVKCRAVLEWKIEKFRKAEETSRPDGQGPSPIDPAPTPENGTKKEAPADLGFLDGAAPPTPTHQD
jgi:hypothetical protein